MDADADAPPAGRRIPAHGPAAPGRRPQRGWTLLELMLVFAIIATLAAIGIPMVRSALRQSKQERTIQDLRAIETEIQIYQTRFGALPASLADVRPAPPQDPWGNPYIYLNIQAGARRGAVRKDRFLVPLNTDFDLYSMGPDGRSTPALTAKDSRDDILRANNGNFFGVAADY